MSKLVIRIEDGRGGEPVSSEAVRSPSDTIFNLSKRLIRRVKEVNGDETSAKLINALKEVLGTEWSQQMVLDVLENGPDSDQYITFTVDPKTFNKPINLIKAIRTGSGIGLYDAKKVYENLLSEVRAYYAAHGLAATADNSPCIRMYVAEHRRNDTLRELYASGANIL